MPAGSRRPLPFGFRDALVVRGGVELLLQLEREEQELALDVSGGYPFVQESLRPVLHLRERPPQRLSTVARGLVLRAEVLAAAGGPRSTGGIDVRVAAGSWPAADGAAPRLHATEPYRRVGHACQCLPTSYSSAGMHAERH